MSYVDTSVIVAALDPLDPRSGRARKPLEEGGCGLPRGLRRVEAVAAMPLIYSRGLTSSTNNALW